MSLERIRIDSTSTDETVLHKAHHEKFFIVKDNPIW